MSDERGATSDGHGGTTELAETMLKLHRELPKARTAHDSLPDRDNEPA